MKNRITIPATRCSRLAVAVVGLVACAAPSRNAESRPLRATAPGYETQILVDGVPAPTFWHEGESYVLGHTGQRYVIRVLNHSGRRIEAVVTVDGRDVIDGKNGDFQHKRGYLVPAWGQVDIDGWRLSESQAAAFRFSSVADSYAARTGNAREVGVIGVAIFPERIYRPRPVLVPPAPPCCMEGYRNSDDLSDSLSGQKGAAPAPSAAGQASEAAPPARASRKAAASADYAPRRERPGLGTEFGEAVASQIQEVEFVRANAGVPSVILGVRYNDHDGLLAMGVNVDSVYPWPGRVGSCRAPLGTDHRGKEWKPSQGFHNDDTELRRTADPFPSSPRRYASPPSGWER